MTDQVSAPGARISLSRIAGDKVTDAHKATWAEPGAIVIKTNSPTAYWYARLQETPSLDGIPDGFVPVVELALKEAAERILRRRVQQVIEQKVTAEWLPAELLSADAVLAEASGQGQMSYDSLLNLFRATAKGREVAAKLDKLAGPAKKVFAGKMARFHNILKALTAKGESALAGLTPKDLDFILLSIPEADEATPYATWVARRVEEVRPTVEAQDSDDAL